MAITCSYIENAGPINHADEQRRVHEALLSGRYGAINANDLAVSANGTPNTTVNVGVGRAFVPGSSANWQGTYHVTSDAVVNVDCGVADATNPRNDLIVLHVYDNLYDASGKNFAVFEVLKGTPSGAPVDPTVPANCHVLARCYRPAATNPIGTGAATITSLRQFIYNTGQLGAATLSAAGASGLAAALPARLIGASNNPGPPTVGTWQTNDVVVDFNGAIWVCYSGGTPGVWKPPGPVTFDNQSPIAGSSFNLAAVPSWARLVEIIWRVRSGANAQTDPLAVQFNNDAGANYDSSRGTLTATYNSGGGLLGQTSIQFADVPAATSPAPHWATGVLRIPFPGVTGNERGTQGWATRHDGGAFGPQMSGGNWRNTVNPINLITVLLAAGPFNSCNFIAIAYP